MLEIKECLQTKNAKLQAKLNTELAKFSALLENFSKNKTKSGKFVVKSKILTEFS